MIFFCTGTKHWILPWIKEYQMQLSHILKISKDLTCIYSDTAWKVFKYGVFSGPNAGNTDQKKLCVCKHFSRSVNLWKLFFFNNKLFLKLKLIHSFMFNFFTEMNVTLFSLTVYQKTINKSILYYPVFLILCMYGTLFYVLLKCVEMYINITEKKDSCVKIYQIEREDFLRFYISI